MSVDADGGQTGIPGHLAGVGEEFSRHTLSLGLIGHAHPVERAVGPDIPGEPGPVNGGVGPSRYSSDSTLKAQG